MDNKQAIEILKDDAHWLQEQIKDLEENEDKDISQSMINGCKAGIAAHQAAITLLQNDWVSVDAPPENKGWYHVYIPTRLCKEMRIDKVHYSKDKNIWHYGANNILPTELITHWRPLPTSPKEQSDELS